MGNVLRPFPEPMAFEGTSQVGLYIINYIIRSCQEKQKGSSWHDLRLKRRDNFENHGYLKSDTANRTSKGMSLRTQTYQRTKNHLQKRISEKNEI